MRNLTSAWKECNSPIYPRVIFTFTDGQILEVKGKNKFKISGNEFADCAGTTSFPVGAALAKTVTLALWNDDDRYRNYSFYMAHMVVFACKDLNDGTIESVKIGEFTITTPESYGTTVEVVGIDDMYKLDVDAISFSNFGIFDLVVQELNHVGILNRNLPSYENWTEYGQISFESDQNYTIRQIVADAAQLIGCNVRFDEDNVLQFIPVGGDYLNMSDLYGGILDEGESNPFVTDTGDTLISDTGEALGADGGSYITGDIADGGAFNPWNVGYICDSGTFEQLNDFQVLTEFKSDPSKSTDDFVVTGVRYSDDESTVQSGEDGYVLSFTNNLLTNANLKKAAKNVGDILIGLQFRPIDGDIFNNISIEFGDMAYFMDYKGYAHKAIITDVNYVFGGYTSVKCAADDPLRNSASYYSQTVNKAVQRSQSKAENAFSSLTNLVTQSMGLFETSKADANGGTIRYLHDKPNLADSKTVWRMADNVFTVTNNYQKTDEDTTWTAGFDKNGNLAINLLSAVGISFDWAKGGILNLGGKEETHGDGSLYIYNSNDELVGIFNANGIRSQYGNEWLTIHESLMSGGHGSTTDGILDLSQKDGNVYDVVLESKTGSTVLKAKKGFEINVEDKVTGNLMATNEDLLRFSKSYIEATGGDDEEDPDFMEDLSPDDQKEILGLSVGTYGGKPALYIIDRNGTQYLLAKDSFLKS